MRNVLLGISLAAPIGPAGVAVIRGGLRQGFAHAFLTGLGVTMADATYLLVVYFGLSSFIGMRVVKTAVGALGAFVLLFLGYQSIHGASRGIDLEEANRYRVRNPLLIGYLINISNPVAVVWWVGVFGSVVAEQGGGASRVGALLSGSMILIGILLWHATTSLIAHWGRRFLNERILKYVSIAAGVALILFGMRFAYITALAALGR